MSDLRIAVVGAGVIGQTHIDAIRQNEGVCLSAIAEPCAAGAAIAARLGCAHFTDLDALIATGCDGAVIATPNALHVSQALRCLEAGIPVLVEKPLAENARACAELLNMARRSGTPGLVGHHRRHNPILRAARAAIDEGRFGTLVSGSVSVTLKKPDSYFDVPWRGEAGSGGPLLINLIHEIDLMRHLFGEITEVSAMTSHRQRNLAVEDSAAVLLRFEGGGLVTVSLTDAGIGPWCWDTTSGENLGRFPANPAQSHLFSGTRAGLSLPDLAVWTHDGAADWTVPQSARLLGAATGNAYEEQIRHFAAVIRGDELPRITLEDGARNLAVIEAIRASVAEARPVAPVPVRIDVAAPARASQAMSEME